MDLRFIIEHVHSEASLGIVQDFFWLRRKEKEKDQ